MHFPLQTSYSLIYALTSCLLFLSFLFWVCFVFYFYIGRYVCLCIMHVQMAKRALDSLEMASWTDAMSAGNCTQVLGQAISALIPKPCPQSLPKSSCSSSYILKKTVIVILVCHRRLLHWDILPLCLDYKGFYHVKMLGLSSDYFGNHWIGSWIHLCGELCLLTYACRTFLHHWNETNFIINLNQDWICIPKYSLQVLCWEFLCLCLPVRLACQSTFLWSFIWFY